MIGEPDVRDTYTNLRLALDRVGIEAEEHQVKSATLVRGVHYHRSHPARACSLVLDRDSPGSRGWHSKRYMWGVGVRRFFDMSMNESRMGVGGNDRGVNGGGIYLWGGFDGLARVHARADVGRRGANGWRISRHAAFAA